jgi:hypothetical protein
MLVIINNMYKIELFHSEFHPTSYYLKAMSVQTVAETMHCCWIKYKLLIHAFV